MRRQSRQEALNNFGSGFIRIVGFIIIAIVVINFLGRDDDTSSTSSNHTVVETPSDSNATFAESSIIENEAESEEEIEVIETTATEIIDTYSANEIRGNEMFSDKHARITGTVDSISETFGRPYVTMPTESDEWSFTSLQIFFENPDSEPLSTLEKGQTITIEGVIDGMSMNVVVNDATIIQ